MLEPVKIGATDPAAVQQRRMIETSLENLGRLYESAEKYDLAIKQYERIIDEYKTSIIIVNKWDLAKGSATTEDYEDYLTKVLPGLKTVPIAFTTASEGKNIQSVLDLTTEIYKQANTKVPTPKLNKAIEVISSQKVSGSRKNVGFPKIYYGTQVATSPVSILLFVNKPEFFDDNYLRFAANRLREMLDIEEVPIRLLVRARR